MKDRHPFWLLWSVLSPLLFYYVVMLLAMAVTQQLLGADDAHYVISQLISTLVTLPCMIPIYRQAQPFRAQEEKKRSGKRETALHGLWAVLIVGLLSISLNNIISMTPLVELSAGYRAANAGFYGSTLFLELVSSAIATPVLEELVFRGIVLDRLKSSLSAPPAAAVSALLFALMHFNIVQFLYALAIGVVLAIFADRAGLYAAVVGHITANALAVLRTETGILAWSMDGSAPAWVLSVAAFAAGIVILSAYLYKYRH